VFKLKVPIWPMLRTSLCWDGSSEPLARQVLTAGSLFRRGCSSSRRGLDGGKNAAPQTRKEASETRIGEAIPKGLIDTATSAVGISPGAGPAKEIAAVRGQLDALRHVSWREVTAVRRGRRIPLEPQITISLCISP
jgi:hypothetical protein